MTVEELDIIVQAHIEGAVKEFQKLVPEIKKQTKNITKELNNSDIKNLSAKIDLSQVSKGVQNVKQEAKQVAKTIQQEYGNAFKSTSKQQELLYEKIKQKQQELEQMKLNSVPVNASDDEIKAKMKQTGKVPQFIDKTAILETEAEIEKLENKLISLQKTNVGNTVANAGKQIKTAFDNPNITNFTTNLKQTILGVSQEFSKLRGSKIDLGNAVELNNYKNKVQEISNIANKAKDNLKGIGYVKYDTNSIDNYISKLEQAEGKNLKAKMNNIGNQSFYAQDIKKPKITGFATGNYEIPKPDGQSLSLWDTLRSKIQSLQPAIQQAKSSVLKMFGSAIISGATAITSGLQKGFNSIVSGAKKAVSATGQIVKKMTIIPSIAQGIGNKIKGLGSSVGGGIKQVIKYAGALLSLRSIYMTLRQSASAWLSSQNAGAQQLSANIDYMKYAMGSALAPIIQFVTNLVFKLMKAIQSVVYALFKVNIFANASASAMKQTGKNTKKAKEEAKQLAGVHDEINNIESNDNDSGDTSGGSISPSFDLSGIDNVRSDILDAIKNGDWYQVGALLGEKLNNALASIPWDKIQNTARNIATNIANFLNGFIETTDWNLVGNTLAQGINTVIYFAESFVTTFHWDSLGMAIANGINGLFLNIDWMALSNTLANGINGLLTTINTAFTNINWTEITSRFIAGLNNLIHSIDWGVLGETFANGINAVINILYTSVTQFDWIGTASALAESVNSLFKNVDWTKAGQTLGEGVKGIFNSISTFIQEVDWTAIGEGIVEFITNIDWGGVISSLCSALGAAIGGASQLIAELLLDGIIYPLANFFLEKTEECGGNVILGLLKGIVDGLIGIGEWIYNNMIYPFIEAFCNALGIHSPSTVFAEFGKNIIQGLFNGIKSLINKIKEIWENIKQTAVNIFNNIKTTLTNIVSKIKTTIVNIWNNIKTSISNVINTIKTAISNWVTNIKTKITTAFSNIKTSISNSVNSIKTKITTAFKTAYTNIKNTFSKIGSFFSSIWNTVKNTFSKLGTSIGNAISGAVKSGINGVISLIQNTINGAIRLINGGINLINLIPGVNIGQIGYLSLPRLEKGGVLYEETAFIGGEYSGANNNPEIVAPQNVMYDTMRRALSDSDLGNNDDRPINITIKVGNKKLGEILIEDLKDKKRRTGKGIEALVGG